MIILPTSQSAMLLLNHLEMQQSKNGMKKRDLLQEKSTTSLSVHLTDQPSVKLNRF